jgi:hypothetical protein
MYNNISENCVAFVFYYEDGGNRFYEIWYLAIRFLHVTYQKMTFFIDAVRTSNLTL